MLVARYDWSLMGICPFGLSWVTVGRRFGRGDEVSQRAGLHPAVVDLPPAEPIGQLSQGNGSKVVRLKEYERNTLLVCRGEGTGGMRDDAQEVQFFPFSELPENIAFISHRQALADYTRRYRGQTP